MGWGVALCATTALAGAVPRPCVRGARGRFGGFGPVPGVVSLPFPSSRPACPALSVGAVPFRCPLPSLAGTTFHTVCAFRVLGLVALLVVPACPLRVCALALSRRALSPPWVVWRAHLARSRHWALVGPFHLVRAPPRVLPRSLAPSGVPGGAGPVPVPPYLAWGCGGGGRASPGGVPSTVSRGVWGQALPLPRLPAHWAGCWGPLSTCCGRGRAGVGALLCPLGLHALWGLRAAGRVCGVCVPVGGLGGGGVRRAPRLCGRGGSVGRGVALPCSVPLPSRGRQQSGCHWRRSVHGGRGPPYGSGSCLPAFTGRDLCGVLARWRGLACSPRFLREPVAGAGGRAALRLLSRAGGGGLIPPASGGGGRGPRGLRAGGGGGGGGCAAASLLPLWVAARGTPSWPPSCGRRTPHRRARAVGVVEPPGDGRG